MKKLNLLILLFPFLFSAQILQEFPPYQVPYKGGYAGWSIPSTTKNPGDIVKLADFLASREGKLLANYGIEGRDYTLDDKGNPLVKESVLDLKEKYLQHLKHL